MVFNNMSAGSSDVYPQISTDINTTFHGGIGYYYGNLMDSKTGNMVLNLYDGEYDTETGGMTGKGQTSSSTSTTVSLATLRLPLLCQAPIP